MFLADERVYIADGNAFRAKKMIEILDAEKNVLATVGRDLEGNGYYLKKGKTMQVAKFFCLALQLLSETVAAAYNWDALPLG